MSELLHLHEVPHDLFTILLADRRIHDRYLGPVRKQPIRVLLLLVLSLLEFQLAQLPCERRFAPPQKPELLRVPRQFRLLD